MSNTNDKGLLMAIYALFAVGVFFPLLTIVGVVVSHVKSGDAASDWGKSHHKWLKSTFWYSLLWTVCVVVLLMIPFINIVGWICAAGLGIWYLYRIIKGGLYMMDTKPMYQA